MSDEKCLICDHYICNHGRYGCHVDGCKCVRTCYVADHPNYAERAAEIERLRADINSASNALRILYANLKTATTAMERCGLTAMVDGIRADIVTEPCVSALSKAVPKEEI